MKNIKYFMFLVVVGVIFFACNMPAPPPATSTLKPKHNYIILLDLSDRLIIQSEQSERDIDIIKSIYNIFEDRVRKNLFIKSRDEIKVVIAPQKGSDLETHIFEDRLFIKMENINNMKRRGEEAKRKEDFFANLDTLYKKAKFSDTPDDYYGADIWKYFYEDLKGDYSKDTLTTNFLFILTDGYPIVGKDRSKLQPIKNQFPDLKVVLVEAAPREKDMEWDSIIETWTEWFSEIGINDYTLIKRKAITKEKDAIKDLIEGNN